MSAESHPVVIDVDDEELSSQKKLNVDKSTHEEEEEQQVQGNKSLYDTLCGGNCLTASVVPLLTLGAIFCLAGGISTLVCLIILEIKIFC